MAEGNGDWLRVRGIGRERFAGYVADYLATLGYTVERSETAEPSESRVAAHLGRMNPAVPPSAADVTFRFYPTSGGAALVWETPTAIPAEERGRMDRFVREMTLHLERAVATESHATAKVTRPTDFRLPWENGARPGPSQA
ncbi:MAG TPA: hypothetical protein VMG81_04135 [Thermoplasmata archaeon]|nr:hypothetical protein [Thermoplasmata archaeon]